MEDSNEVHSDENRISPEKNPRRILKTPAQLNALENFYNEHKYPTEEMKLELAEHIGLTEKQISSWFCHRRLKDKRRDEAHGNGRQDRSSGILQDRGSGLRQDSCGSTKQGDYRNVEPREVDSQRLYGRDFAAGDLTYDHSSRFTGNLNGMDSSSESSSSSQDKFFSQTEDPCNMGISRYLTQDGAMVPSIPKGASKMGYKPAGFLKVKGEMENAAITSVKRQLGRNYREDGPLLGVEFDPVPPGAFSSPSRDLGNGPFYVGDLVHNHSSDVSGAQKRSSLNPKVNGSKMSSQSYMEEPNHIPMYGSNSHYRKSHSRIKQASTPFNYPNSNLAGKADLDKFDDIAGETTNHSRKRNKKMSAKHGNEGVRSDFLSKHPGPDSWKISSEKTEPWSDDYENKCTKMTKKKDCMRKPSQLMPGSSRSLDAEKKALCARMAKDDKLYGETEGMNEYGDLVRVKMHPGDESIKGLKPFEGEGPQQEHATKASFSNIPGRVNLSKGSVMERPSSFSEDETAETSSSVD